MRIHVATSIMCLLLAALPAHASKYVYVSYAVNEDYHDGKDSVTINTDIGFMYADHGSQKIELCGKNAALFCFYGSSINFAVPKTHFSVGASWKNGDRTFDAKRIETIELLGQRVPVYVLSSKVSSDRTDYFYYSESRGLLGIKFSYTEESSTRFVLLVQKRGFPR